MKIIESKRGLKLFFDLKNKIEMNKDLGKIKKKLLFLKNLL
jgi:hypothetical protein